MANMLQLNNNSSLFGKLHYRSSFFWAVLFHIVLLALLISSVWWSRPSAYQMPNQAIQATLINSATLAAMQKANNSAKPALPPKPELKTNKPAPQSIAKPIEKTPVKEAAKQQIISKAVPVEKTSKQQPDLLEQSLQQEEQLQKMTTKAAQKNQQKLLEQQLNAEMSSESQSTTKAQAQAMSAKTQGEIDEYKAKILQQIQQNWIIPQNVTKLTCLLQVSVAPGGMVLNVTVLKSSGNEALDRSAVAAVNKASPLPVPKDSLAFAAFRTFTITVKPEGASDIS